MPRQNRKPYRNRGNDDQHPPYSTQQAYPRQQTSYEDNRPFSQNENFYQSYSQPYSVPNGCNGWNSEQNYNHNYAINWQNGWYGAQYPIAGPSNYNNASSWNGYNNFNQRDIYPNGWNGGYFSHDYQLSTHRPIRYEGNRHIHTPVSGQSSRFPSPGKEDRRRSPNLKEDMRESSYFQSRSSWRDRESDPAANPIVNAPRKEYLKQTLQKPGSYPVNMQTPKPLPLLVLDLNGTLVYRSSRSSGNAADRSKFPTLRPYLSCFLQYCLAVDVERQPDSNAYQEAWQKWQENRMNGSETQDNEKTQEVDGDLSPRHVHGTHFWTKKDSEPEPLQSATYRLLLWSSAQPQNVDHMARAILNPKQAEQLLRVYARDTLVTRKFYSFKAPSVKDLEILWAALNNLSNDDRQSNKRGEERLFAEARDREDRRVQQDQKALEELYDLWKRKIVLPIEQANAGIYSDGFGYGPHNTLLLDDSISKARIQPFNHLLVPEFDEQRAKVVKNYKKKQAQEGEHQEEFSEAEEEPEDILLQIIGVLEHARYQKNVSSWIRFGGLGNLGNVGDQHPYNDGLRTFEADEVDEAEKQAMKDWQAYFTDHAEAQENDNQGPRLRVCLADRTAAFWAEEGRQALSRRGIKAII